MSAVANCFERRSQPLLLYYKVRPSYKTFNLLLYFVKNMSYTRVLCKKVSSRAARQFPKVLGTRYRTKSAEISLTEKYQLKIVIGTQKYKKIFLQLPTSTHISLQIPPNLEFSLLKKTFHHGD